MDDVANGMRRAPWGVDVDFSTTSDGHAAGGPVVRPTFHGTAGSMLPIVLKGLFLTIVTLGIYRFWYVTDVRRFLWNNTEVDSDLLEYTGRGVELFIGFLIALAVVIPLYGVLFLIASLTGPVGAALVSSIQGFAILFLAQYALFRARRYRLTRTIWRGVRFQQTGSGWSYALKSFGWGLLTVVTLGLAYPFMRASLERYKMTNTWYGDQQGGFSATGGRLFKRGVALWLIAILVIAAPIAIAAVSGAMSDVEDPGADISFIHFVPVLGIPLIFLFVPLYLAIEFRWWAEGCSVGPARAQCDLTLFAFFKVYLGYVGVVLLFGVALGVVGGGGFVLLQGTGVLEAEEAGPAQIGVMVAVAILYFMVALAFAALWQLFVIRPVWRKSFESVTISGLPALVAAQSLAPEANAFGEGIADAIDFGGF